MGVGQLFQGQVPLDGNHGGHCTAAAKGYSTQ